MKNSCSRQNRVVTNLMQRVTHSKCSLYDTCVITNSCYDKITVSRTWSNVITNSIRHRYELNTLLLWYICHRCDMCAITHSCDDKLSLSRTWRNVITNSIQNRCDTYVITNSCNDKFTLSRTWLNVITNSIRISVIHMSSRTHVLTNSCHHELDTNWSRTRYAISRNTKNIVHVSILMCCCMYVRM